MTAGQSPRRIVVFPYWNENPFLNVMYLAPRAAGIEVVRITSPDQLALELKRTGEGDIVHIHWTQLIAQSAANEADARDAVKHFSQLIDKARLRGAKLVWTVHNRLPHECKYPEVEVSLSRFLVDSADVVHVMAEETASIVSPLYPLDPKRTVRVPHPSYIGIYDGDIDRESARDRFGFETSDFVVVFLGQIRPYKGLERLIEAVHEARSVLRVRLLIGGSVRPSDYEAALKTLIRDAGYVSFQFDFIPDEDAGQWFAAADLAVFPYLDVLNSGSVEFAASYGTPVLMPDVPSLQTEYGAQEWAHYFDSHATSRELGERIVELSRNVPDTAREARAHAVQRSPYRFSTRMLEVYRDLR